VLLAGDAGVGKTRLAHEVLRQTGWPVLHGAATQDGTAPYEPLVAALRHLRRLTPSALDTGADPLIAYLGALLPEVGTPPGASDHATLAAALRAALEAIARLDPRPAIFLDDLHWADSATLDLLPALAEWLEDVPLLVLGAYRTDEIPRGNPLRRMRTELRRAAHLNEISLEPLDRTETTRLAAALLGGTPGPGLALALHDRTQGVPFFVEELAAALTGAGRVQVNNAGELELIGDEAEVPIPSSVRDAVLLRADTLSDDARSALDIAAVAGVAFDLALVSQLAPGGEGALQEPLERGLIVEDPIRPGVAAFRHALVREALYGDIIWTRRRALHQQVAELLVKRGASDLVIAEHLQLAGDPVRARGALLSAADAAMAIYAYRDAAQAARRALELWPEDVDEQRRLYALDRYGHCAELSGDLVEACRAWREVAEAHRASGDAYARADVERRLATVYDLQGAWERSIATRQSAGHAFAASGHLQEAATERIAAATRLQAAGTYNAALELLALARTEAETSGRLDLQALALAIEGAVQAKLGNYTLGAQAAHAGLAMALEHNLHATAVDAYVKLASVFETNSDYGGARVTLQAAIDFCSTRGVTAVQGCISCLAYVERVAGGWSDVVSMCRPIVDDPASDPFVRTVAGAELGLMYALQGQAGRARGLLNEALAGGRQHEFIAVQFESAWGLAVLADLDDNVGGALEQIRFVLDRWQHSEDRHYAIGPLRWASSFLVRRGEGALARGCASALAHITANAPHGEALSGVAFALAECAVLDGDLDQAMRHFSRSLDLLQTLEMPYERALTQLRLGEVLAANGERAAAVTRLVDAYRGARKLTARPLALRAARELKRLGEPIERRLGRGAVNQLESAGLSRREMEVMRLVAVGRTNQEIGRHLFLSTRTVDMHVRNVLAKLGARSRAEATHRADQLGLLTPA